MISDLSASIRARMKGQFSPLNDDILMLNRGAATGVSSRLWDTQASVTSGESGEIINSVASDYFVNSDVSPRDPLLFQQEDESLYDWMKRKQQIGDIGAAADIEDGDNQVTITVKEKELPSASAAAANAASDEDKKMAETSVGGVDAQPVTPQQGRYSVLL